MHYLYSCVVRDYATPKIHKTQSRACVFPVQWDDRLRANERRRLTAPKIIF